MAVHYEPPKKDDKENFEYKVLVPLQDTNFTETLLSPAIRAVHQNNGKILLLNVIEIPYQLPPSEAERYKLEREFLLQYACQIIETSGSKFEKLVRIAHRLSYAIEKISTERNINLIILGANRENIFWGRKVYPKLVNVSSDLIIAKEPVKSNFNMIVVKADNLHRIQSMLIHATYLMENKKGTIHLMSDLQQPTIDKVRSIVEIFLEQNSWFVGKILINQPNSESLSSTYQKIQHYKKISKAAILLPFPPQKKTKIGTLFEEGLKLPVFYSKSDLIEPVGINLLPKKIKERFEFYK